MNLPPVVAEPRESPAELRGALPWRVEQHRFTVTRGGSLHPWIGPALRGALALRFKEAVCRHPAGERAARWVHCNGCPHLAECSYGRLLEPEGIPTSFRGQAEAPRPLILSSTFPLPSRVGAGDQLIIRVVLLGELPGEASAELGRALAAAGGAGLGPDRVRLRWEEVGGSAAGHLKPAELPAHPFAVAAPPARIRVRLFAPLFLEQHSGGGRRAVTLPSLADLLRASLRGLGGLFRNWAEPLHADFAGLKEISQLARLTRHEFRPFQQRRWSSRSGDRYSVHGVSGWGEYENVAPSLIPWLTWGGMLHVGAHRVAGAGCWVAEEMEPAPIGRRPR